MKKKMAEDLEVGMKLAEAVTSSDGRVLLTKGVGLTKEYIGAIRERGIPAVYIENEYTSDLEFKPAINVQKKKKVVKVVKESMNNISFGEEIDYKKIKKSANILLSEIKKNKDLIFNLNGIRAYSEYTFAHSVNVAILATLIGLESSLKLKDIKELAIGALLHDIGKIKITKDIILKPAKLSKKEFEEIKLHTTKGYQILKDADRISYRSAHIAYEHHERLNGQGYPQSLTGDEIHIFAQITAVADIYDAMTTDRVYSKAVSPHQALKVLKAEADNKKIKREFVDVLLKYIAPYPVGTMVKLNNGYQGVVLKNNKHKLSSPIIRIIKKKGGVEVDSLYDLDLRKKADLSIVEIIADN